MGARDAGCTLSGAEGAGDWHWKLLPVPPSLAAWVMGELGAC